MKARQEAYKKLVTSLEGLIKVYRSLLAVVRTEKEILVSADLDDLNENNKAKEKMLIDLRKLESERQEITKELVKHLDTNLENPSLLEISKLFSGEEADKLRSLHQVLDLLIRRVKEFNLHNEQLINSALENITGAMGSIKDILEENKTYQKKGKVQGQPAEAGQLVSRKA